MASNAYSNAVTFASNASNMTNGTVSSLRISGSYAGITSVGNLTSLTISGNTLVTGSANIAQNLRIGGDVTIVGNLQYTGLSLGDFIPASNGYFLGNTTSRWYLNATDVNINGNTVSNNLIIVNTANVATLNVTNVNVSGTLNSTSISQLKTIQQDWSLMDSNTVSFTGTTQQLLDLVPAITWRGGEYLIQMNSGSSYQITKILLIHDGTTPFITEYGTISTGANLGIIDAIINSGNVRLLITPTVDTLNVKFSRTMLAQ
jgi:hypothetical protein